MCEQLSSDGGQGLAVGAAASDVTPRSSTFLYGYPHVLRESTGVHDPLYASAMAFRNDGNSAIFVSVDTIWLAKQFVAEAKSKISAECSVSTDRVMISATHTHSGPVTLSMLSNAEDPVVPPPDPHYLTTLMEGIIVAAVEAARTMEPAEIAFVSTDCSEIGSNRLDPRGPTIQEIPIVVARPLCTSGRYLGMMYINRVHPTVLHEDSTLISADFPGLCRRYLQRQLLGTNCPVLSHLGAAGNQSPRFTARAHTFAEAERIGSALGQAIERAMRTANYSSNHSIECRSTSIQLPPREMPIADAAERQLQAARSMVETLQASGATYGAIRTAECAVFGAEETLCLTKAQEAGTLRAVQDGCLPAEIQVVRFGPWFFISWPGEVFVEFALQVRQSFPDAQIITLANGELQGYLVTEDAVQDGCYEAANSIFSSPAAGQALVDTTLRLLRASASGPHCDSSLAVADGRS